MEIWFGWNSGHLSTTKAQLPFRNTRSEVSGRGPHESCIPLRPNGRIFIAVLPTCVSRLAIE